MTITTREFEYNDADYALLTELWNKAWPEYHRTPRVYRHEDDSRPKEPHFVRLFFEQNGTPVAVAEYMEDWETTAEDDYFFLMAIDPDIDFKSVADPFVQLMMSDIKQRGAVSALGTILMEDRTAGCQFLESIGFKPEMREPRSELDVGEFDFAPYSGIDALVESHGIEIARLTELKERYPDWKRRIYDLDWPILQDVPSTVEFKQQPYEEFIQKFDSPAFMAESAFYALDGDKWVGISTVKKVDGKDDELSVGFTGVLKSHRRKGIATALKLKTIEFAKAYGARIIKTDNEENNPMYDLNMQLGFKPKPALLIYEKKSQTADADKVSEGGA